MKNLASLVSKESVLQALEHIDAQRPRLIPSTKFHVHHRGKVYPPKELVRFAATFQGIKDLKEYRLIGGKSTNQHLQRLGFTIINFRDLKKFQLLGPQENEKRIARICWNSNGWVQPSGRIGKSVLKTSHEGKFGYGHEEWLFDMGKIINGFHYGFLEPIRKQQSAYTDRSFDVWLYAIDGETKNRYWLGEIKNVIAINEADAAVVHETYQAKGWINEMEEQIRLSGANPKGFSDWNGVDLFNVKFRMEDIDFREYIELPYDSPIKSVTRYSFSRFLPEYEVPISEPAIFTFIPPTEKIPSEQILTTTIIHRQPKASQITNLHQIISQKLVVELGKVYGSKNVAPEHPSGFGAGRIDIVVNDEGVYRFYEIKTYASLETSVREALGQILEYALCPDSNKAKELIIVTQQHHDDRLVNTYFPHLRKTLGFPIYFQFFDLKSQSLSRKY